MLPCAVHAIAIAIACVCACVVANAHVPACATAIVLVTANAHVPACAYASATAPAYAFANAVANAVAYAIANAVAQPSQLPQGDLMRIDLTIDLHSYCAHPYRPEMEKVITITKESGMSRARSSANRRKALEEYLRSAGMTLADYDDLEKRANEPWDVDDDNHIIIPRLNVTSMLVAMSDSIRAAGKPCPPTMVRTLLRPSEWHTTATPGDAQIWERFAVVTSGTGAKLSNQRGLRKNFYIGALPPEGEPTKPVVATGTLDINPTMVRPEVLETALSWAGEWVGIGASRKMGWGRFTPIGFEVLP